MKGLTWTDQHHCVIPSHSISLLTSSPLHQFALKRHLIVLPTPLYTPSSFLLQSTNSTKEKSVYPFHEQILLPFWITFTTAKPRSHNPSILHQGLLPRSKLSYCNSRIHYCHTIVLHSVNNQITRKTVGASVSHPNPFNNIITGTPQPPAISKPRLILRINSDRSAA